MLVLKMVDLWAALKVVKMAVLMVVVLVVLMVD